MQTFLPYPDFRLSARCLDNKRLGKQRVEAWQILRTLLGENEGWKNHPAVRMWYRKTTALKIYSDAIVREWINRGFKNNMKLFFEDDNFVCYDFPICFMYDLLEGKNDRKTR